MGKRWASVTIWRVIWPTMGFLAGRVLRDRPTGALVALVVIILGGAVLLWRQWE